MFVSQANERGLPAGPLVARPYSGRGKYRTGLLGWYVTVDHTAAIGIDGEFYVLTVPPSVRALVTGITLEPHDPPLIFGEGGRDGESIPLKMLLHERLDSGDAFP
jgi:hypothetical protein